MLDRLIKELEAALRDRPNGYVTRFEQILAQVAEHNDQRCIGLLLQLLDDTYEYDELMFSIVHTIESFPDSVYVREIIKHLRAFYAKSPRWTVIVHMRIFNSQSCLSEYREALRSARIEDRQVLRDVLQAVLQKNAKFEETCTMLAASL